MGDDRRIQIPGWAVYATSALVAVILATVGTLSWLGGHYVSRDDHMAHAQLEDRMRAQLAEAQKLDADNLARHVNDTRMDSARLAAIEVQIQAVREDLAWLRTRMERRQQQ